MRKYMYMYTYMYVYMYMYVCVGLLRCYWPSPLILQPGIVFASVTEIIFLLAGGGNVKEVVRGFRL